ncbi:MAG: ATP-binding protein [Oscillospiraceae bacterium]|jgi:predicted AAA+ superfamily ATPase|nr:ATP-binding protein [Oscillospiraceae bacterium]
MLRRRTYADDILKYADTGTVKILTGMKRAGKTSVLLSVQDELAARGVPKKNIVNLSFEGLENSAIEDYQSLYAAVSAKAEQDEKLYVFLDEVQRVVGWEKAALHLMHDANADIYAAGSNAKITDKSVMAVLENRVKVFEILPLSFSEYLEFRGQYAQTEDIPRELVRYLLTGGFPDLHVRSHTQAEAYAYIRDVMNAAVWTDVVGLGQLRRPDQLERVTRFIFENVGSNFSAKHVSDSLRGQNKEINIETVYTYIERLETAYLIARCRRYDLQADEPLKTQEKFYPADAAMRYALLGFKPSAVSTGLENAVYLEMKRRGFEVYMGKLGRREIDFVAISGDRRVYLQLGSELHGREEGLKSSLVAVRDHYPKLILTTDLTSLGNSGGIRTVSIADFLAGITSLDV